MVADTATNSYTYFGPRVATPNAVCARLLFASDNRPRPLRTVCIPKISLSLQWLPMHSCLWCGFPLFALLTPNIRRPSLMPTLPLMRLKRSIRHTLSLCVTSARLSVLTRRFARRAARRATTRPSCRSPWMTLAVIPTFPLTLATLTVPRLHHSCRLPDQRSPSKRCLSPSTVAGMRARDCLSLFVYAG